MSQAKFLDDLAAKFSALLAASPAKDLEKNVRVLLSSTFTRLDLVTREEFDIQRELLTRTRERLALLEARVADLESKLGAKP
jgi:BMFP domain-containing protein YqiC